MKISKKIITVICCTAALLVLSMPISPLICSAQAYNPLSEADENLSNLEKARLLLDYFQKSGVDSDWAYDIETNKEVVEDMLGACAALTDEEISEITLEEQEAFTAYFQKLYEVSGLDAVELGNLFEIKGLERAVDDISHVDDKKADTLEEQQQELKAEKSRHTAKIVVITVTLLVLFAFLAVALSKAMKKSADKTE
ncbi:MAG: hypothetical protein RR273_06400 [Oscillospiraceae bacterium]